MAEQQAGGDANDDDEVQMLGEQTWQERDAAAREAAVEIDDYSHGAPLRKQGP